MSAGIGVIGMASPMLQEIFGGKLIGHPELGFGALDGEQKAAVAAIAAGFAGLLSLFNIGGRFFWASLSDYIGRKNTYYTFFVLGIVLYALGAVLRPDRHKALFVLAFGVILSMYGGGFATVPAYLADMFGTQFVGAIHGRLLTAWSTAGIIGRWWSTTSANRRSRRACRATTSTTSHVYPGRHAGHRPHLQLPGQAGGAEMVHEPDEVAKLQATSASGGATSGSYGIGKGGLDLRRFSGASSAFRWPGASGRHCRLQPRSSDTPLFAK